MFEHYSNHATRKPHIPSYSSAVGHVLFKLGPAGSGVEQAAAVQLALQVYLGGVVQQAPGGAQKLLLQRNIMERGKRWTQKGTDTG